MLPKTTPKSKTTLELENTLAELLKKPRRRMTKEERAEQRLSFVYGNLPSRFGLSREDVAGILARHHGE